MSIDPPHSRHRAGRRRPPPLSVPQLLGGTRSQVSSAPGPPQNSAFISFLDLARRGPLRKTQLLSAFWILLASACSAKLSSYQLFGPCSPRPAPQNSAFISFLDLARRGPLRKTQLLSAFWTLLVSACSPKPHIRHRLILKLSSYQCFGGHHRRNHGRLNVYQCFSQGPSTFTPSCFFLKHQFFLKHREALARQMHSTNWGDDRSPVSIAISDKSLNRGCYRPKEHLRQGGIKMGSASKPSLSGFRAPPELSFRQSPAILPIHRPLSRTFESPRSGSSRLRCVPHP